MTLTTSRARTSCSIRLSSTKILASLVRAQHRQQTTCEPLARKSFGAQLTHSLLSRSSFSLADSATRGAQVQTHPAFDRPRYARLRSCLYVRTLVVEYILVHPCSPQPCGGIDVVFTSMILLTYRAHWTPLHMLELLIFRFFAQPPKKYLSLSELDSWNTTHLEPIQSAVTGVLTTWIERYWKQDMEEDPVFIDLLLNVIDVMLVGKQHNNARRAVKQALSYQLFPRESELLYGSKATKPKKYPRPIMPPKVQYTSDMPHSRLHPSRRYSHSAVGGGCGGCYWCWLCCARTTDAHADTVRHPSDRGGTAADAGRVGVLCLDTVDRVPRPTVAEEDQDGRCAVYHALDRSL